MAPQGLTLKPRELRVLPVRQLGLQWMPGLAKDENPACSECLKKYSSFPLGMQSVKEAATPALGRIRHIEGELECQQCRSEIIHGGDQLAARGRDFADQFINPIQRIDSARLLVACH